MMGTDFEGHSEEWKEVWKNEHLHTVAAFHNTAGGVLIIGRRDDGTVVGVESPKKVLKTISDTISNKLHVMAEVKLVTVDGKNCISVNVPKGDSMVDCDGIFYIRIGNTTQTVSGSELKVLLLEERNKSWLDQPSDLEIDDLSVDAIAFFISKGQKADRIPMDISADDVHNILSKFKLLSSGKVTLAGALLFYPNARMLNDGAYLKIGQFDEKESLMRDTYIEGPIIRLPDLVMEKLYEAYTPPTYMYDGGGASRYLKYDYPEEAVRELVLNAVMHMDYSLQRPMTISVFPDRLEIFCAGLLPKGMTFELMKRRHTSVPRNVSLATVFYSAGYVESWGQGISKVRGECIVNGNPEPEYQEFCGGVLVTIKKPQKSNTVEVSETIVVSDEIDRLILKLIRDEPQISAVGLSTKLGLNVKTVYRHTSALRNAGIITRDGNNRNGCWTIKKDIEF